MQAKHLPPNFVTLANIVFGFLGIINAAEGRFDVACWLLFAAGLCDMSDGPLARKLGAASNFGKELDSLSDAISFGIAPALTVYFARLHELGWIGIAICVFYVLCGVLRLARFNVTSNALSKVTFIGTPIPAAAGYMISFVLVRQELPIEVFALGTLAMGALMVSTLKIPKFGGGLPTPLLLLTVVAFPPVFIWPSLVTWSIWAGTNLVMVPLNYVNLYRKGLLSPPDDDSTVQPAV